MPKVKKTVDTAGRPGYTYKCTCGKQITLYWENQEPAPDHLEVCFNCINVKL